MVWISTANFAAVWTTVDFVEVWTSTNLQTFGLLLILVTVFYEFDYSLGSVSADSVIGLSLNNGLGLPLVITSRHRIRTIGSACF